MLKALGEHTEIALSEEAWVALEQAGSVPLSLHSRQLIEDALARWIRVQPANRRNDFARIANKPIRNYLKKIHTSVGRLNKAFALSEEFAMACSKNFTRDILANGADWGVQCGECDRSSNCFVLPGPVYLYEVLGYLIGLRTALGKVAVCNSISGRNRRWLDQRVKDATTLQGLLTPSESATEIGATPMGSAVLLDGGGIDPVRDAAIHVVWYHLQKAIQFKHCSQNDPAILLHYLELVSNIAMEETTGGKRANQKNRLLAGTITQCELAYTRSNGKVRFFFCADDQPFANLDDEVFDENYKNKTSEFILFMCAVNNAAKDTGFPLLGTPKAIADATWKVCSPMRAYR